MKSVAAARRTWLVIGGVALMVVVACTFIVRDGVVSGYPVDQWP
ncbi:MAG: hypothetical protein ABW033_07335 [Acidimicrobiia bacterium]